MLVDANGVRRRGHLQREYRLLRRRLGNMLGARRRRFGLRRMRRGVRQRKAL